jgi:hypothetical protein
MTINFINNSSAINNNIIDNGGYSNIHCKLCRKKKLKCDRKLPNCSRCILNKAECEYVKKSRFYKFQFKLENPKEFKAYTAQQGKLKVDKINFTNLFSYIFSPKKLKYRI